MNKHYENELIEGFVYFNTWLQNKDIRYCLIGGLAAGFWGEPRYTKDMDFTIVTHDNKIDQIANQLRENPDLTVHQKGNSQLAVKHKHKSSFMADLILAETDLQDWVVQRAIKIKLFDMNIPVCSAEDLIILKLIARRRQDLLDIENVLRKHHLSLDRDYLKKCCIEWDLVKAFEVEFGKEYPDYLA